MILSGIKFRDKGGRKENRFRHSIDVLMRSPADEYGFRVIGAVITGMLDDGGSGLCSIKRLSGTSVVLAPEGAL